MWGILTKCSWQENQYFVRCYAASLALHLSDDLLDEVNKSLISHLQQKNIKADAARTYVQTIGAVRSHPAQFLKRKLSK